MAEKHDSVEKIVTIPLRKGLQKAARDNRTKRAVYEIRQYVFRHTKADDVKVSKLVNELLWKRGIQKPPAKIKVKLVVSEGVAKVMLPDEIEEKKEEKKGVAASLKDRITGKHEHKEGAGEKIDGLIEKAAEKGGSGIVKDMINVGKEANEPIKTEKKK